MARIVRVDRRGVKSFVPCNPVYNPTHDSLWLQLPKQNLVVRTGRKILSIAAKDGIAVKKRARFRTQGHRFPTTEVSQPQDIPIQIGQFPSVG